MPTLPGIVPVAVEHNLGHQCLRQPHVLDQRTAHAVTDSQLDRCRRYPD
ncbi:hypothetical protein Z029_05640 [Mycobacterium tuberculosis INS_SEN]|nr:hypothetical protein M943_05485 [Mycobacterium tuberculosis EAI5]EUA95783.1 hypothetical protein Z029_05640 [Mycobacterium tuberculosis INS_SEN]MXI71610.1 hypothetical protein [Mycobacterium tuberculosis]CPB05432.1 Uncharacterised protein [Mycobacterium tuberculosis]